MAEDFEAEEVFYRNLKPLGNYREFAHGDPNGESLRDHLSKVEQEHEAQIIAYLQSGYITAVAACIVQDVLDESIKLPVGFYQQTDFVWSWYSDLAYYVKTYHLTLPEEFTEHLKAKNWEIGAVPEKFVSLNLLRSNR